MLKKKIIFILVIFFSLIAVAETYVCNILLAPVDEFENDFPAEENHLLEREGEFFLHIQDDEVRDPYKIIRETQSYILLQRGLRIVMIDTQKLKIGQYWIRIPNKKDPNFGTCRRKILGKW